MNYAGFTKKFFEIVIVTLHPFGCCSTIKTYASHSFECLPLCCLTSLSSHCSVFKVQYFQPLLKPDLKIQIPLGFEIQQQTAVFCLVGLSGLEPPTLRLSVVRSSQLSYGPASRRNPLRHVSAYGENCTPLLCLSFFGTNPLRWASFRLGRGCGF